MRTLYLFRHAKSDWEDRSIDDVDRPLNKRGFAAAQKMAAYCQENGITPAQILCSASQRTRETLACLLFRQTQDLAILIEEQLYLAEANTLLNRLGKVDSAVPSVMLIAHNPGTGILAKQLSGAGDPSSLASIKLKFPTAALAEIRFEMEHWSDIAPGSGTLVRFVLPRQLADET